MQKFSEDAFNRTRVSLRCKWFQHIIFEFISILFRESRRIRVSRISVKKKHRRASNKMVININYELYVSNVKNV